ncbi:hypothetical protein ABPG72_012293 [Tetrahymena utriculariae]
MSNQISNNSKDNYLQNGQTDKKSMTPNVPTNRETQEKNTNPYNLKKEEVHKYVNLDSNEETVDTLFIQQENNNSNNSSKKIDDNKQSKSLNNSEETKEINKSITQQHSQLESQQKIALQNTGENVQVKDTNKQNVQTLKEGQQAIAQPQISNLQAQSKVVTQNIPQQKVQQIQQIKVQQNEADTQIFQKQHQQQQKQQQQQQKQQQQQQQQNTQNALLGQIQNEAKISNDFNNANQKQIKDVMQENNFLQLQIQKQQPQQYLQNNLSHHNLQQLQQNPAYRDISGNDNNTNIPQLPFSNQPNNVNPIPKQDQFRRNLNNQELVQQQNQHNIQNTKEFLQKQDLQILQQNYFKPQQQNANQESVYLKIVKKIGFDKESDALKANNLDQHLQNRDQNQIDTQENHLITKSQLQEKIINNPLNIQYNQFQQYKSLKLNPIVSVTIEKYTAFTQQPMNQQQLIQQHLLQQQQQRQDQDSKLVLDGNNQKNNSSQQPINQIQYQQNQQQIDQMKLDTKNKYDINYELSKNLKVFEELRENLQHGLQDLQNRDNNLLADEMIIETIQKLDKEITTCQTPQNQQKQTVLNAQTKINFDNIREKSQQNINSEGKLLNQSNEVIINNQILFKQQESSEQQQKILNPQFLINNQIKQNNLEVPKDKQNIQNQTTSPANDFNQKRQRSATLNDELINLEPNFSKKKDNQQEIVLVKTPNYYEKNKLKIENCCNSELENDYAIFLFYNIESGEKKEEEQYIYTYVIINKQQNFKNIVNQCYLFSKEIKQNYILSLFHAFYEAIETIKKQNIPEDSNIDVYVPNKVCKRYFDQNFIKKINQDMINSLKLKIGNCHINTYLIKNYQP